MKRFVFGAVAVVLLGGAAMAAESAGDAQQKIWEAVLKDDQSVMANIDQQIADLRAGKVLADLEAKRAVLAKRVALDHQALGSMAPAPVAPALGDAKPSAVAPKATAPHK